MEDDVVIQLKVHKSPIHGEGIARMHEKHLKEIEVEEGELGVVFVGEEDEEKAILVKIFADKMIDEGMINLRKGDLKALEIDEGDLVNVTEFHKASDILKEKLGDVKEKMEHLKDKIVGFFKKEDEEEE